MVNSVDSAGRQRKLAPTIHNYSVTLRRQNKPSNAQEPKRLLCYMAKIEQTQLHPGTKTALNNYCVICTKPRHRHRSSVYSLSKF